MPLKSGLRAFVILVGLSQMVQAQVCRLALALALDVSGSVDPAEYALQINGLAGALNAPEVRAEILNGGGAPISLVVYEWSSRNHQFVIQPWISLEGPDALDGAISRIRAHRKVRAGLKTALGTSLLFGASLMQERDGCWAKTIDVSGDGENNIGPTPIQAYETGEFQGITVNALVIGDGSSASAEGSGANSQELLTYYQSQVIRGPGAFAMIARGYRDYANAMRRKLMRELSQPIVGLNDF